MTSTRPLQWAFLSLVCAFASACAGPAMPQAAGPLRTREGVAAQACSESLHELCAQLLLYSAQYRLLPSDLTELPNLTTSPVCPATREPYLYNPAGWPVGKVGEHVIACDARPIHLGRRLGILVQPTEPGQPLVLKVAELPPDFQPR